VRGVSGALMLAMVAGPVAAQVGSPAGPVPVERLKARREALFQRLGTGVAIIRSAETRSIEGDYPQDSDYRERNDFFYFTGLEAPGGTLVLVAQDSQPDRAVLFIPARNPMSERWTGPQLGPGPEATAITGITDVHAADSMTQLVRPLLAVARRGSLFIYRTKEELEAPGP
jgi:Xaa-Pro aminopeptidase